MPVDQTESSIDLRESTLPPPLRAGIGLVAAGVDKAKHLPGRVSLTGLATLPMRGLSLVAGARETVERTYEELSNRGETVLARWRHRPEPRQTNGAPTDGQVTERGAARDGDGTWDGAASHDGGASSNGQAEARTAAEAVEEVVDPFGLPEQVAEAVEEATPGATLAHDQLPLEDYDHLTLGQLRSRLVKLDAVSLIQLRDYERAHAHRLPILTMLENRIAKVGAGSQPTA